MRPFCNLGLLTTVRATGKGATPSNCPKYFKTRGEVYSAGLHV